jgi:hypothetical protein
MEVARAGLEHYEHELDHYEVRAPIDGVIGSVTDCTPGTYLPAGRALGSIIPDDQARVVAHYPPHEAVGRVRPGQHGHIRLDAYSWLVSGSLGGTVSAVASEPDSRGIRVEVTLDERLPAGIPLEHGLTGRLEIGVAELSPLAVVLSRIGRLGWRTPPARPRSEDEDRGALPAASTTDLPDIGAAYGRTRETVSERTGVQPFHERRSEKKDPR